ncbi:hypothetical protein ES319_A09G012900v1 [Gossypium barbadense]|uniref:Uncharacterized protein n=1 Tax=Gossypium barbadense TaxID=3634 RepID=A0A5J5UCH8_GOSBA|nr:hypothetical protein ES319_A09G012900v1 [Gossypium barbadense]
MGLRNIFTGIRFNFSVPKYTDIAVNFTDGMFKGIYNGKQHHVSDIATVLSRAWNAGVDRIIVMGGSLEESKEALAIAETDGRLFCTVGVHPTRCKEFEESGDPKKHFQALLALAKEGIQKGKVVAIGECGLDYDRLHFCPPEVQKKYFEKQFELAYATKLLMFLICVLLQKISVKLWNEILTSSLVGLLIHLPVVLKTVISFSHFITCI